MARLLAIISRQPIDITVSVQQPEHIMMATHGWGVGWYEQNKPIVQKGTRSILHPEQNDPVELSLMTRICMVHLRKATSGEISKQNTHPFTYASYMFAHIGTVHKEELYRKLQPPYNSNFQSEPIDSEVYFRLIVQNSQDRSITDAVREVSKLIQDRNNGASFILSTGNELYAYRQKEPLYWLRWNYQRSLSIPSSSGLTLNSNGLANSQAYIITSEKIFDGNWTAFDDGELFMVDQNLQYTSTQLQ